MEIRDWRPPSARGVAGALSFLLSSPGSKMLPCENDSYLYFHSDSLANHEVIPSGGREAGSLLRNPGNLRP